MQRPSTCNHEDFPCCGCGTESSQEEQREQAEAMEELAGVDPLNDEDEDQEEDDEPWDGFRSDADADQDVLNGVYGYDPENCDTPMGDDYGGE